MPGFVSKRAALLVLEYWLRLCEQQHTWEHGLTPLVVAMSAHTSHFHWDTTFERGEYGKPDRWIVSDDQLTASKKDGLGCNTSIMAARIA